MKIDIVKIGNSKGIRIPKSLLESCDLKDRADLSVKDGKLIITSLNESRAGWAVAFKTMAANGDDAPLVESASLSDWDETEWQW